MVTRLLGPDGAPIDLSTLRHEVATAMPTGVRSVHSDAVSTGLTPERLARILRDASTGDARAYLTLAIEMEERYLHYAAQLQTRRLAFDALEASVEPQEGTPNDVADAVTALVGAPTFRDATSSLSDAVSKGFAAVEIGWDYADGLLQPVSYSERDQRFFTFDRTDLRTPLLAADGGFERGTPLPPGRFLFHTPHIRAGVPLRRGLARAAAWGFLMQNFSLQDWARFAEIYGIPFRLGRYHPGSSDADRRALLNAVRAIGNDAAAIVPRGMDIEFHAVAGTQGAQVFGNLIDYLDRSISKLVLGQTMTSDNGSSLGQAKIHNEVRIDILRSDARQMEITVDRDLVTWFVAFNFGPKAKPPRVRFPVTEAEDIKALADALDRTVPLGLAVSQRQIRHKFGLSEPEAGEALLAPAARPVAPPAALSATSCGCAQCTGERNARLSADRAAGAAGDEIDAIADGALDNWEDVAQPLLDEIFAMVSEAGSFEEALRKLDRLRLDAGPLRAALARATAMARGIGDVKDLPDATG